MTSNLSVIVVNQNECISFIIAMYREQQIDDILQYID